MARPRPGPTPQKGLVPSRAATSTTPGDSPVSCCAVVLALTTVGCGSTTGSANQGGPKGQRQGASIELDPKWRGSMEVAPSEAEPGQTVALTYPPEHRDVRGVAFSLSEWTVDGWKVTHYLTSNSPRSSQTGRWSV